jgi:hypothetical protein
MSIESRVKKLEQETPVDGLCACVKCTEVRIYDVPKSKAAADADTRPPDMCLVCSGEKRIIKVVFVEGWTRSTEYSDARKPAESEDWPDEISPA